MCVPHIMRKNSFELRELDMDLYNGVIFCLRFDNLLFSIYSNITVFPSQQICLHIAIYQIPLTYFPTIAQ